jgi:hypothetical protein
MQRPDKYGLIGALLSLLGSWSGNMVGAACLLLGGGLVLLIRSFFPPLGLVKGLAAYCGGGILLGTIYGSGYLAYNFIPWNSPRLLTGFLPSFSLGALLVYLSFRN